MDHRAITAIPVISSFVVLVQIVVVIVVFWSHISY
jgi:hypothetical protein